MEFVSVTRTAGIAEVVLQRGKVNALNEQVVDELSLCFRYLAEDANARAVIFTGAGPFFSFGFDIPQFLDCSKDSFSEFLTGFTGLYTDLFMYPKPLIAALNGHAIAGGCMLAIACDHRIMVSGKAKISLNEITFGASVFAGHVEMLKFLVGGRNAQQILYTGAMYSADQALQLGMVDRVSAADRLMQDAREFANQLAAQDANAFHCTKRLLRSPQLSQIHNTEEQSIREFVSIWYSSRTWKNLQAIKIR
jgi:enoyl-CoA hydratase/carnithine racemase